MNEERVRALEDMRAKTPGDTRVLFALANEYEKGEDWPHVVGLLTDYLERARDEGNAWGRLGHALSRLGRVAEARDAYARGIEAANQHGHPTMAAEFEESLGHLGPQ